MYIQLLPKNKALISILKTTIICSIFTPIEHNWGSTGSHTPQQQHQQQPQVYNTSPLSATYVHENAQYVVPSVDTVRGFPTRGGIVPKRGRKRRHTATVHNMTPETAERNRCRICNKQFKRPSSLQTHYYSHTGEKFSSVLGMAVEDCFLLNLI